MFKYQNGQIQILSVLSVGVVCSGITMSFVQAIHRCMNICVKNAALFIIVSNDMEVDVEIRQCGNDWRYCDGDCANCTIGKTIATDRTEVNDDGD